MEQVLDSRVIWDQLRETSPVVAQDDGTFMLLSYDLVRGAAEEPLTFSSAVSAHRALPNSLDGRVHRSYREIVDRYMGPTQVAAQEEQCARNAAVVVDNIPTGQTFDALTQLGVPFAVATQCEWLGWPPSTAQELVDWMADNRAAAGSGDKELFADLAQRFDQIISNLLVGREANPEGDVTSQLMAEKVGGRALSTPEIVSILRNWTAGDLGSLAASTAVIAYQLATDPQLQQYLRSLVAANDQVAFEEAVHELLRIDDPFVSNRRITTRDVTLDGVTIPKGSRVFLNWTSANRDPEAFPNPDQFNPDQNDAKNLVFGAGPHVCPGKALTLMELRTVIWQLLDRTTWVHPSPDQEGVREALPNNGWAFAPLVLERSHG